MANLKNILRARWFKVLLSVLAVVFILIHHIWFEIKIGHAISTLALYAKEKTKIDVTTISLLLIAVLVWLYPLIARIRIIGPYLREVRTSTWVRLLISTVAISLAIIHTAHPTFPDAITIGLLILIILPWLTSLIESAKFPGGWEVKFRDVQAAGHKVASSSSVALAASDLPKPSFLSIATQDSNLALVGLRIEIEKRLRDLAERYNIPEQRSLIRIIHELRKRELFPHEFISGLEELVRAGNSAAHGATVEPTVAQWAIDYGPVVLASLDEKREA
jgi:hypothetical protein